MWQVHWKLQWVYAKTKSWRDTGDTLGPCHSGVFVVFSILKLTECADCIKTIANRWREQNDFGIDDMLVFDGELIDSLRRWEEYCNFE